MLNFCGYWTRKEENIGSSPNWRRAISLGCPRPSFSTQIENKLEISNRLGILWASNSPPEQRISVPLLSRAHHAQMGSALLSVPAPQRAPFFHSSYATTPRLSHGPITSLRFSSSRGVSFLSSSSSSSSSSSVVDEETNSSPPDDLSLQSESDPDGSSFRYWWFDPSSLCLQDSDDRRVILITLIPWWFCVCLLDYIYLCFLLESERIESDYVICLATRTVF